MRDGSEPAPERLREADRHGYLVTGIEILFRGLCPRCQDVPAGATAG